MTDNKKRKVEEMSKQEYQPPCAAPLKYRKELVETARKICASGKGILAADESTGTIGKRLATINQENTLENRQNYRDILFTTEGLENYISGVIMYEETLNQSSPSTGKTFVEILSSKGIVSGIKVDLGLRVIPGTDNEWVTQGATDLDKRAKSYYEKGARFAKWRAAYSIGDNKPSQLAIDQQANQLARYAALCQANGLCPIVEPEVLMDGDHSIEKCAWVSERVWAAVVKALNEHHVFLEGSLLKPNMILPGKGSGKKATPHEVASYTVRSLQRTIPAAIPGINFLSGGQTEEEATLNLDAMNKLKAVKPWNLSFSYGRALQASVLKAWMGDMKNRKKAQDALIVRAKANGEAQEGKYKGDAASKDAQQSLFEANYAY